MNFRISGLLAVVAFVIALALDQTHAATPTLVTLVSFDANTGAVNSLVADDNGNLFGTTSAEADGFGTVYEIAKTASGYASTPTTLVKFAGDTDGASPENLIVDANGNLFGIVGANGVGTVFEIAKTASGYASTPTTLVSFSGGTVGTVPVTLIVDTRGNLFGTTFEGGANGVGTVFEIAKTASGYASTPSTLVNFTGTSVVFPFSLLVDADGNLFGTTGEGGENGFGTVYEIAKTAGGYASTPTTLVNFTGDTNGFFPQDLIADANDNLFGATGNAKSLGTVFEIVKTASGYASTPTTLVSFICCTTGTGPGNLIVDARGNLFGTTSGFGSEPPTMFEIVKTASGYASTPTTLVSLNSSPEALIADANGNLFGTTSNGGTHGCCGGTVFEITGSGFVVPVTFAGTPGKANCHGQSVSALARQFGGLNAAAAALGYSDVSALQIAIMAFCED